MTTIRKIIGYTVLMAMAALLSVLLNGCGNSDGSLSFSKSQTAELVKQLGTYEGQAHAQRVMGAMMTGVWAATFFQDDDGALKCKSTLRLHDSENGWGNPTVATANVKIYKGAAYGLYDLKAEASFSDSEPNWFVAVDGVSPTSGNSVGTITLFDMDSYQITLTRK